ncbi:MAG: hypothetical protein ACTHKF_09505, partial [Candidatus Nitrosocosmicus sp.]
AASHLFEENGKLEEVAQKASGWFRCYFQIWFKIKKGFKLVVKLINISCNLVLIVMTSQIRYNKI